VALAVASAVAAVTVWQRVGPDDGVVNRSYLLTMLVGAAGLLAAFALRGPLLRWAGRADGLIDRINRRALTIYLWQGFGLVAAQRLVDQRIDAPLPRALLSIAVVAAVVVAAVRAFGWIEDLAARRDGRSVDAREASRPRSLLVWIAPGVALLVATAVLPPPATSAVEAPLSGRAVVARAGLVEESLATGGAEAPIVTTLPAGRSVDEVMSAWAEEHREFLDRIGFTRVELAIALPDGEVRHQMWPRDAVAGPPLMPWWSMTKVLTTAWLAQLVADGVVALDDPLSRWLPEMPNADRMTLEQLARHTAGISASVESPAFEATPAGDLERYVADPGLDHEPGETFSYSRVGYFLLALALERASGEEWVDVVRDMGDRAGVEIALDEPVDPNAPSTHPDGLDYRGGLWSSGAVLTTVPDGARLVQWLFSEELEPAEIELMADFSDDPDAWYYGLGLLPVCPCEPAGDGRLRADRVGLDSLTGSFNVDPQDRTAVLIRPDSWWDGEEPGTPFFDLQRRLLDAVSPSG
jgi:CubicO group peptidase (beta-lactamase class C family)